jgi:hypothetical protein
MATVIVVPIACGVIPSSSLGPFASSSGGGREKRPSLHIHEGPAQDLMAPEKRGSDINQSEPRLRRWLAHNLVPLCVWDRGVE